MPTGEFIMEYRYLGKSGLEVSALAYGAWVTFGNQMGVEEAQACMEAAYAAGVNFFDNAEVYAHGEAERIMGEVFARTGWKRSELVVSTKIFWGGERPNARGLSRKHLVEGLDASLARLQLEYVDLLFAHRPDIHTPIEETVRAMTWLINQGKAFYWGTSEWSAQQITQAHLVARREHLIPPTMEQPQYNMFHREGVEKEYAPLYETVGLGTTTWSPLASGLLTGKYLHGTPEGTRISLEGYEWLRKRFESPEAKAQLEKVRQLAPIADEIGATLPQLALAWCLKNPHVSTVITGASQVAQVRENMKAVGFVESLTPAIMERIEAVLQNRPQPAPDFRS